MGVTPPRVPLFIKTLADNDLCWRNPAPDAAAPACPTGKFGTATISASGTPYIVIVSSDDWEATYVDGKLFNEGQSVMCSEAHSLITHLGYHIVEIHSPKFEDYFDENDLPETLEQLYRDTEVQELRHCVPLG